ncbi:type II membrane protein [Spiromyces aspiralis]|uniref:Type II membrane protein n=1 Tax=Spiromyces aspiralis TaxID=68401 RepID=A0ACC1HPY0_9FUNG|nr:type II membrane protein [Spiromyces aspiralis]
MDGQVVNGQRWSTEILFVCDKSNDASPKVERFEDGHLKIRWEVLAACGGESKAPDNGDDSKKPNDGAKDGGSFFGTLFTIILVVFIIYFGVGMVYNYLQNGYRGLDLIPHREFWREFPYLCIDFGRYVWDRVSGRSRGGYSVV